MALTVNGDPHLWRQGMTVAELLAEKVFTFPMKIVFVNKALVKREDYATAKLEDGDVVEVVHLTGGG
jgi:thiamine biosynthesis protein ThiS